MAKPLPQETRELFEEWMESAGAGRDSDAGAALLSAVERLWQLKEVAFDDHGVPYWKREEGELVYLFEE